MRRRVVEVSTILPPRLAVFIAADWEGRDDAERYSEWMDAREAWKDERKIAILPDDEEAWAGFPDAPWRAEDL